MLRKTTYLDSCSQWHYNYSPITVTLFGSKVKLLAGMLLSVQHNLF